MRCGRNILRLGVVLIAAHVLAFAGRAKDSAAVVAPTKFATLHIPKLELRPTLGDFLDMQPSPAVAGKMLKVDGFLQRDPKDGAPASQRTEAYLGYTDKNLYVVFLAFDDMSQLRAHMVRREQI